MTTATYRKCSKCSRTRAQDKSVSYHRFPNPGLKNITKAIAWAQYCWPNKEWTPASLKQLHISSKVLCGRHFASNQFYDNMRQKLSKFAVPDLEDIRLLLNERQNIYQESAGKSTKEFVSKIKNELDEVSSDTIITMPVKPKPPVSEIETLLDESSSDTIVFAVVPESDESSRDSLLQNVTQETIFQLKSRLYKQNLVTAPKKRCSILKSINVSSVEELNNREQKLYKICRDKTREIIRLQNKIKLIKTKSND